MLWEFVIKGGPLMIPLALCSVLTLVFGIERSWHYLRAGRDGGAPDRIHALIEGGEADQAMALASASAGPVAAVLAEGLRHRGEDRDMLEEAVSLRGAAELERLNRHLHVLELVGRLAPLLGLLGTVLGMVAAFRQVAGARGAVEPSLLAGGIWEALLTTVAGLSVAIPAMVLHHLFENKVRSFAYRMKHYGMEAAKHLGLRA
mgnify:CR=1 FL=1